LARPLLEEVIRIHADEDSPDYNECGGMNSTEDDCMWCEDAKKVLAALRTPSAPSAALPTAARHFFRNRVARLSRRRIVTCMRCGVSEDAAGYFGWNDCAAPLRERKT